MFKLFMVLGSLNALISVALGAFGAHGLKSRLSPDMLAVYQTGVHYHMMHALGIIAVALIVDRLGGTAMAAWSGGLFCAGIVFFSGSLYILSITGIKWLGAITPLGGIAFLVGWALLALAAILKS